MPITVLGGTKLADTTFSVANSCRFNDGDSPQLEMDMGDNPTLKTKYSFSCWIKPSTTGTNKCILGEGVGLTAQGDLRLMPDDNLAISERLASEARYDLTTTRLFRDVGAWYNIIVIYDSTQGTASNRVKIYVNGVQETAFDGTPTYPAEDAESQMNQGGALMQVGCQHVHDGSFRNFMDGYMAEVVFIDGTAYAHTDFGEFDEDSPTIWKPKDVSGLTFGANGYYLDFEDSSNLGNDANGGTDFTETNLAAVDQTTDSPTNSFCTINSLDNYYYDSVLSEGNCKITTDDSNKTFNTSTFAVTAGKWYWECKASDTNSDDAQFGIASVLSTATDDELKTSAGNYCYRSPGTKATGDSSTSYGATWNDDGDIISVALDLDNLKIYFAKNGTWQDSGDPTSGATGTGAAFTITAPASQTLDGSINAYTPAFGEEGAQSDVFEVNFGNPSYANSSDAADENGYGAFEYAPPSGYLALCTKNLGSDGG